MRGVQLNQVKTGFTGVGHGLAEVVHDTRNFIQLKRARHRGIHADRIAVFITQGRTGICAQGRSGDRSLAARLNAAMGDTTGMPQLDRNAALFSVNARGDFLPCGDLFRAVKTRRTRITFSLSGNLRGFGDDQARACALTIVFTHQWSWDVARLNAAQTGKRSHKHAVWRSDGTHF